MKKLITFFTDYVNPYTFANNTPANAIREADIAQYSINQIHNSGSLSEVSSLMQKLSNQYSEKVVDFLRQYELKNNALPAPFSRKRV